MHYIIDQGRHARGPYHAITKSKVLMRKTTESVGMSFAKVKEQGLKNEKNKME